MVRASVLESSVSWVRIPPEQLFFLFGEKRVVWVSCLPLFSIYRKEFSCMLNNTSSKSDTVRMNLHSHIIFFPVIVITPVKLRLGFHYYQ